MWEPRTITVFFVFAFISSNWGPQILSRHSEPLYNPDICVLSNSPSPHPSRPSSLSSAADLKTRGKVSIEILHGVYTLKDEDTCTKLRFS